MTFTIGSFYGPQCNAKVLSAVVYLIPKAISSAPSPCPRMQIPKPSNRQRRRIDGNGVLRIFAHLRRLCSNVEFCTELHIATGACQHNHKSPLKLLSNACPLISTSMAPTRITHLQEDTSVDFFDLPSDSECDEVACDSEDELIQRIAVPGPGASMQTWSDCVHKYQIQAAAQRKEILRLREIIERLESVTKGKRKHVDASVPTDLVKEQARLRKLGKLFAIANGFWLSDAAYDFTERPNIDLNDHTVYRSPNPHVAEAVQAAQLHDATSHNKTVTKYLGSSSYVRDVMNRGIADQKSYIVSGVVSVLPALMPQYAEILNLEPKERKDHPEALRLHGKKGNHFPPLFYKDGHAGETEHLFWIDALPGVLRTILFGPSATRSERVDTRSLGFGLRLSCLPIGLVATGLVIIRHCFSGEESFLADSPSCNNSELHAVMRATLVEFRGTPFFVAWFAWLEREVLRGTTRGGFRDPSAVTDTATERENNDVLASLRNATVNVPSQPAAQARQAPVNSVVRVRTTGTYAVPLQPVSGPAPRSTTLSSNAPNHSVAPLSRTSNVTARSLDLPAFTDDIDYPGPSHDAYQTSSVHRDNNNVDDGAITENVAALTLSEPPANKGKGRAPAKKASATRTTKAKKSVVDGSNSGEDVPARQPTRSTRRGAPRK